MSAGFAFSATNFTRAFRFSPVAAHNRFSRSSNCGGSSSDLEIDDDFLPGMARRIASVTRKTPRP